MKIAVSGTRGTLGRALVRHIEGRGDTVIHLNRPEADITHFAAVRRSVEPAELVIHPAAYTNVDGAESDLDGAFLVNGIGTRNLAILCEEMGIPLVYVSTNMVFDGTKGSPYTEFDLPCPKGVYALSKRAGEQYVEHLTRRFYIARTSWVYGKEGDSFVHKIVRAADARGALSVVEDEVATPTYAEDLAEALLKLAETGLYGWYNMVNEGECSRLEFAREIMRLTDRAHIPLSPGKLADYVRPAPTPPYSPLKNTVGAQAGIVLRSWQDALADYLSSTKNVGVPG